MLEFFDCNCSYGLWPTPVFRSFSTPEELIKEMNFCGISKALVHNADMRFHSPIDGNKNLLKEINNHKEAILFSHINDEAKYDIFYRNAEKILKKYLDNSSFTE